MSAVPHLDNFGREALGDAEAVRFGRGIKQVMTQERADSLWDIAAMAMAVAHDPPHPDREKVIKALRQRLDKAKPLFLGENIPEAGFSWR